MLLLQHLLNLKPGRYNLGKYRVALQMGTWMQNAAQHRQQMLWMKTGDESITGSEF